MVAVARLTASDEAAYYALARYAFNLPQSESRDRAFASLYAHSQAWGSGEPLESGVLGTHFEVDFAGTTYKMSGIGYVASYPETAGNGGISAIMKEAFKDMRAAGETLSYLAPFASTFYRRFGYEGAFDQVEHVLPAAAFPKVPQRSNEVTVHRVPFRAAIAAMREVYERSSDATRGGLRRADWWWQNLADHYPDREVAVATLGERPTGYVIYQREAATFRIIEQFHDDLDTLLALARFIGGHRTAYQQFVYTTGNPESLHDLLPDPSVLSTSVHAYMMARIVDVADFMRRYPYQVTDLAPVLIGITDDYIPENAGVWRLALDDGQATFEKATGKPQIALSIQQLVKATFGVRPLQDAYNLGLIDGDPFTITSVGAAFITRQAQLYDYF